MKFSILPLWAKIVIPVAALVLAGFLWHRMVDGYREQGRAEVRAEWAESREKGRREVERLKAEAGKITVVTEIKYVDRIKYVKEKADTIVKTVVQYIPVDKPIDGGFRVFHDGAATNRIPDPAEAANAAPTTLRDVATTVGNNYAKCHIAYETVAAWQTWAEEQCKLNEKGCRYDGGR